MYVLYSRKYSICQCAIKVVLIKQEMVKMQTNIFFPPANAYRNIDKEIEFTPGIFLDAKNPINIFIDIDLSNLAYYTITLGTIMPFLSALSHERIITQTYKHSFLCTYIHTSIHMRTYKHINVTIHVCNSHYLPHNCIQSGLINTGTGNDVSWY